ncbi:GGDEF domain-containing protein [Haliea sp. E1-2-M8]|uniref:GGDEF domain-containing protein n=1 Tax=Haliea sp. E1-2-M8 TaxID=3064706 RepID=UPI002719E18C|nr:GGDEF domain-containing protein [Haliea sp. E1-2-M8]MDO8860688.1 GGDEF domain-containing protein [Haliea sp. E1-2-M8]
MQSSFTDTILFAHYGLASALVCAQLIVLYALSNAARPPAGLGFYSVYFMTALLAWIAFTVAEVASLSVAVNVPAVAAMISSYLLLLAIMQRSDMHRGRYAMGLGCTGACLAVFFLEPAPMLQVYAATTTLFWMALAAISGTRGWRSHNAGDGIVAVGGLAMSAAMLAFVLTMFPAGVDSATATGAAHALQSGAHALVGIGFLASILVDQRQQLLRLTTLDPLTRLLNRRGLEKALHVTLASADRHDQPTAAVMLNVDHLQRLNDHFGADTGDKVLQQVSQCLEVECRASDVLSRYDGDTFLVILPNSDLAAARKLAERIRNRLADASLQVDDQPLTVTVSLGVAEALGAVSLDRLCKDAGLALQLAKRGGRNRVAAVEHRPIQLSGNTAGR